MPPCRNILPTIGSTPLVETQSLDGRPGRLLVGLESQSPGGSIKTGSDVNGQFHSRTRTDLDLERLPYLSAGCRASPNTVSGKRSPMAHRDRSATLFGAGPACRLVASARVRSTIWT